MHYLQQPRYVTTQVSIIRGMDKEDVVSIHTHTHTHTHTMEHYLTIKPKFCHRQQHTWRALR